MKILHSETLFHFTNKQGFEGILNSNFFPRYSKEEYKHSGGTWEYWVPMVCFCDIPLSYISDHIEEYGNYGIGMKREWANNSKLNPVTYYKNNSTYFEKFHELMTKISDQSKEAVHNNKKQEMTRLISRYLFQYYKTHTGHDYKTNKEKCFYNEREWRYVPFLNNEIDLIKDNEEIQNKKEIFNKEMEKHPLMFEPKDISYIIIKNEDERLNTIKLIKDVKGKYNFNDVEILASKLLTIEQIRNDL